MKHLEGLLVNSHLTVRDSVVQFQYGEVVLAVEKCTYLKETYDPFLVANQSSILGDEEYNRIVARCGSTKERPVAKTLKKIRAWRQKTRELPEDDNDSTRMKISDETKIRITPFINSSRFFDLHTLTNSLKSKDINTHGKLERTSMDKRAFEKMLHFNSFKSCIDPGESVAILAAQSIGEPSTQMTLNTFHFAGRGDMKGTLGVPRLRELLMVASINVKTPIMEVPILRSASELRKAKRLQRRWSRLLFAQVFARVDIQEKLSLKLNNHT